MPRRPKISLNRNDSARIESASRIASYRHRDRGESGSDGVSSREEIMVVHTLVYRFSAEARADDIQRFFAGLRDLATESGLVSGFGWRTHLLLPVDEHAKGMTATHVAQFSCADLATL